MVRWTFVVLGLPAVLACSAPEDIAAEIGGRDGANAAGVQGESPSERLDRRLAADASPVEFRDEDLRGDAARDFAYSWPAQVSAIAPLAAMLEAARDEALSAQKAEWEQSIAEFGDMGCITCTSRSYAKGWEVEADTPRFLVLRAETFTYTGGAHGNSRFDALLWDREAEDGKGAAMRPVDLFVHEGALENLAYGDYCQALLEERGESFRSKSRNSTSSKIAPASLNWSWC